MNAFFILKSFTVKIIFPLTIKKIYFLSQRNQSRMYKAIKYPHPLYKTLKGKCPKLDKSQNNGLNLRGS